MCDLLKIKKGISLITLIITIVVLIVLAAAVILSLSNGGPISQARLAAIESNKVADMDKLRIQETNLILKKSSNDYTIDEYVDYLDSNGIIDKEENDDEEVGKPIITLEDGYLYQIEKIPGGKLIIEFVGIGGNLAPKLEISITNASTSEVTVTPIVKRNDGGKLEFYIKEESASDYTLKGQTNNTAYIFTNLIQDKTYDIKVIAKASNGLQAEATAKASTSVIQAAIVTFSYNPNTWTNGNVIVTAEAEDIPAGMTLYIGESVANCTTLATEGITVTENKTVYAVYKDSSNQYGGAATGNVEYIDKSAPNITTTNSSGTYNITIKAQDTASGTVAYYYSTSNSTPTTNATTSTNQEENKWVTFTATTSEVSKTLTNFIASGTYYYWFKDAAGNISDRGTFVTNAITASDIGYTPSDNTWNPGNVQTAITTLYNKYQ